MNYFQLMMEASVVAKLVMLMLIFFSISSWWLIIQKHALLNRTRKDTGEFLSTFRNSARFSEIKSVCDKFPFSPQVGLFLAGFSELNFQLRHQAAGKAGSQPKVRSLESIHRVLQRASFVEVAKLEKNLSQLATTAAVAPFVGLLGTVWGIIEAFGKISAEKSACTMSRCGSA